MVEFSDRAKWVTEWVSQWICNDGAFYPRARELALRGKREGDFRSLRVFLSMELKYSPLPAVRATREELAPADYERVDWESVAEDLIGDDSE